MYKGKEGFSLTPEETAKMISAFEAGTQASVSSAQSEIFKTRMDAALTKAQADLAKPATPTETKPVTTVTTAAATPATVTPAAPKQEKELTINLELDLVKTELSSLIHAEVVSAISDAITKGIQVTGPIPGGGVNGGQVWIKVAE
jgi:hypothetical protein